MQNLLDIKMEINTVQAFAIWKRTEYEKTTTWKDFEIYLNQP